MGKVSYGSDEEDEANSGDDRVKDGLATPTDAAAAKQEVKKRKDRARQRQSSQGAGHIEETSGTFAF